MSTINLISHNHNMKRSDFVVDGKLLPPGLIVNSLLAKTTLRHSFSLSGRTFIYAPVLGVYISHDDRSLMADLATLFSDLKLHAYIRRTVLSEIAWQLSVFVPKDKDIDYHYVTFKNGHLNLKTGELAPLGPEIISVSYIDTEDADVEPVVFKKMLNSQFDPKTQQYIKAFIWSVLCGDNRSHIFLYLFGPGGTGKSTLVNLLCMLVGEEATLTTTLRDLHMDKFECANLTGKRLICINDTEVFKGDLSTLKAITGGDSIIGRVKHEQGSFEVRPRGLLVITGNAMLQTRDASGAIDRRMRVVPMSNLPDKRQFLLYKMNNKWEGPLVKESPGIVRWARMDDKSALDILTGPLPPQMEHIRIEAQHNLNPLIKWISEDLKHTDGTWIGFSTETSPEKILLSARKHLSLYPSYLLFCLKRGIKPLNHNRFTQELVQTCVYMNIPIKKVRRNTGIYIYGLSVKPETLTTEAQIGSPVSKEALPIEEFSDLSSAYDTYDPLLYKNYISMLTKHDSDVRRRLNRVAQFSFSAFYNTPDNNLDTLVSEHIDLCSGLEGVEVPGLNYDFGKPSNDYRRHYKDIFKRSMDKIHTKGIAPLSYKPLGHSPRIIPINYGENFNSVKKFLRFKAYQFIINRFPGCTILDVDLKSCYTSILLGLFPQKLYKIREAIEGPGLWKAMENQFSESGKKALFNKPAVKICTYSSFFGGGSAAMVTGTMEFFRKEIGVTKNEFRKAKYYEALHALARDVSEFVNGTDIIQDFRDVSSFLFKTYKGKSLRGPTGHTYQIRNEDEFRSAYPNFLQSFEFYLLAKSTLLTSEEMKFTVIGHFHDGNVVMVKTDEVSKYEELMNANLEKLRNDLRLYYPQTIEIKRFDCKEDAISPSGETCETKNNSKPQPRPLKRKIT